MRILFTLISFLLLTSATAQSKKELEQAQKNAQAKIDTLTKENSKLTDSNKVLTSKSDSLSKELEKYYGLYTVIKEKVVKKDFDPAKMAAIIDSLKAGRDSLTLQLAAATVNKGDTPMDSVTAAKMDSLMKETEGLLYAVNLLRGKPAKSPKDVKEFIGTWSLVLRKVKVTGQSPRSGIIDVTEDAIGKTSSPLEINPITKITFIDAEFAEFTFKDGTKGKCYFLIEGFSTTKPYYVDFKGTKADFRMYFMNTIVGPRISFEIPGSKGTYYFGQMIQ